MILHLLFDDKFGDYAIHQFSDSIFCSEFVRVVDTVEASYSNETISTVLVYSNAFDELSSRLGDYKAIIFHGLFYPWQEYLLRKIPDQVKIAWVFWGGDIYGRKDVNNLFLTPLSRFLLWLHDSKKWFQNKAFPSHYEVSLDLMRRIDYCLTDVPEDFSFVRQYLGTPIKELWYNYYSIEELLGDLAEETVNGTNILVGNSCSIECNHLDGFGRLSVFPLSESMIIVPLSYGEPWLRNLLLKEGRRRFGNRFLPLIDFLPRKEYNEIIKSCSVVVMPHYRPQAFGNLLTALWLGTRVYLSEKNVLFPFFKRMGAIVFSIETDLKRSNPLALSPLSPNAIEQNRKALSAVYSKDIMCSKNLELVKVLNQ